jgi:integrase
VHDLLDGIIDAGTESRPNRVLANRVFSHFHKMCGWAVERGIISTSPVERMKAPAAETSRDRVLSDDELRMVWRATEAIGWPFEGFVKLLVLTAQRRDEVAGMTRSELDLLSKTWTLPRSRSKNDTEHTVPLSSAASAVIESLPQIRSRQGFMFTTVGERAISGFASAKNGIDARIFKALRKAAEEAGAPAEEEVEAPPRWTFHDLRRTAASGMARLGIPIHVVEAVLNHRSGTIRGVSRIYNRYSYEPEKRAALEAWGRYVEGLVRDTSNVISLAAAR